MVFKYLSHKKGTCLLCGRGPFGRDDDIHLYLVRMCHGSSGERTDQLKRVASDPIARVVVVKFISVSSEDILYSISFVS